MNGLIYVFFVRSQASEKCCESGLGVLDQRKANMGFFSKMPNLLDIRLRWFGPLGHGLLGHGPRFLRHKA